MLMLCCVVESAESQQWQNSSVFILLVLGTHAELAFVIIIVLGAHADFAFAIIVLGSHAELAVNIIIVVVMEVSSISIQLHAFCFFEPVCEAMESWKFNFSPKLITLLEERRLERGQVGCCN